MNTSWPSAFSYVILEVETSFAKFITGNALITRCKTTRREEKAMGSVVKKRRKRMAKKKHKKLLKKTRIQRRNKK